MRNSTKGIIVGTVLLSVGLGMISYGEYKGAEYNEYVAGALVVAGALLWFAPDKLINMIITVLEKVSTFVVNIVALRVGGAKKGNEPQKTEP